MAHAGAVGETHRVAHTPSAAIRDARQSDALRITVWYPAAAGVTETPLQIGPPDHPLFDAGHAAADAPFAPGRHPVILLSHGFGGSARMMAWFGTALARAGDVVIAVDHPGTNGRDPMTMAGGLLIWDRAVDLRAALDASAADGQIGPHLDRQRLGVAGFSLGGLAALVSAGARVDLDHIIAFCHSRAADATCAPQSEAPELTLAAREQALKTPQMAALATHAGDDYAIPGVRAVFVMAPGGIEALAPPSLRTLDTPVAILLGDGDPIAPPASNGRLAATLLPHAALTVLHGVGHYDFLADCTAAGLQQQPLCQHLRVPQQRTHAAAIAAAQAFFASHLGTDGTADAVDDAHAPE
ncbi:alpha/beta hydrolase family protein [Cognatiluteimonas profundi]|uniref:alpha/beta hydrolase family protein n=1 Tax=Cognatiluteimonas profundi TaxID=2594501 RepID=UPI00131E7216|nr:alpha/beta hydrolase [Lysobacter profundi]